MSTTATKENKINVNKATAPEGLNIPESIVALAQLAKEKMKVGEGGVIEVPKDFYEELLPDDLTMAQVKKVQEHNSNLVSAVGLAVGELGNKEFGKHKKFDEVSVEFNANKDKIGLNYQRSKQVPDGSGGQQTKYGILSARYQVAGASNKGSFKKVRDWLSNTAADSFGK